MLADIAEPSLTASGAIPSGSYIYYKQLSDIPPYVPSEYIEIVAPIVAPIVTPIVEPIVEPIVGPIIVPIVEPLIEIPLPEEVVIEEVVIEDIVPMADVA